MNEEKNSGDSGKRIDERWKEEVEKEKKLNTGERVQPAAADRPAEDETEPEPPPAADFQHFLSGLGMQALIFLGVMKNPGTGRREQDLEQAKYIIDVIRMLKEKTAGNLTASEQETLDNLLYELQMAYAKTTG